MKRFFILVAIVFAIFSLKAQLEKYSDFITSSGNFEYVGEIKSSGSKEALQNKVKEWFMTSYTNYSKDAMIDGDIEQGSFTIRGTFQSKQTYNPFAGYYQENTTYLFKVNVEENLISFKIFGAKITSTYVGWGANKNSWDLSEVVQNLLKAQDTLNELEKNKKSSGKEKKEQKEIIKDETERLDSIIPTLKGIISSFERSMRN